MADSNDDNGLTRFLMKVKDNLETSEPETQLSPELIDFKYSFDYKPEYTGKVIYSHNELKAIGEQISEENIAALASELPNKKFWRLPAPGSNAGGRKGANGRGGNEDKFGGKDRGSQGNSRNSRNNRNNKRQGGKKVEKESNEEFMALEEQMESTGNPMADFENWKNKMKELERKKKGIDSDAKRESDAFAAAPSQGFSSISDFFNLKPNDQKSAPLEELESTTSLDDLSKQSSGPQEQEYEDIHNGSRGHGATAAPNKSNSSRFSSFFQAGSSPDSTENHPIAKPPSQHSEDSRPAAGSRLLSLFSNESPLSASVPQQTALDPRNVVNSPVIHQQSSATSISSTTSSTPSQQRSISRSGKENDANGSVFLKNLMNKGKNGPVDSSVPAPPGLSQNQSQIPKITHHQQHQLHHQHQQQLQQQQQQQQQQQPYGKAAQSIGQASAPIQTPQGFPVGMPPHMMAPPMGMPPQHFQGGYAMPPPPPPGMGQPRVMNKGKGFPEHMNSALQQPSTVPKQQAGEPVQHIQGVAQGNPQQPYMMSGVPVNFNGQNFPNPPQGFSPTAFPYGHPMMAMQFQQQQQQHQHQQPQHQQPHQYQQHQHQQHQQQSRQPNSHQ
ncbi:unnamed protein product [Kluyveromyces dobzhanskii CBS 2104]|uniref:WGS project CCBQ000000000 data, contig 00015 n=1 Tax=Kluyveromyces dobzhanskii CBS 2104 TaxID=1427455 RepID=A0A0A8LCW7_9SACH|nr:unnamed protein product [Kluyveromyces dobzhanskii CBS 2104]